MLCGAGRSGRRGRWRAEGACCPDGGGGGHVPKRAGQARVAHRARSAPDLAAASCLDTPRLCIGALWVRGAAPPREEPIAFGRIVRSQEGPSSFSSRQGQRARGWRHAVTCTRDSQASLSLPASFRFFYFPPIGSPVSRGFYCHLRI